ncbi:MAG: beta-N-acetylhexosaminidase [Gammaproteobacteria bacterium]
MTQKLSIGPVMIDLEGLTLAGHERDMLRHPNTGAVILFKRNFADPEQVAALIRDIRAARNGDLLIAVDQEGGRVQRFQRGFTRLPPAAAYARHSIELARDAGWLMAAEVLAVDADFSFAPVLDVDCGISTVIGDRSFAQDPLLAAELAGAFRGGMNAAGMSAVGKHFPGHGAVAVDSHLDLPVDSRTLEAIRSKDLLPFKKLIDSGLEGIMPAHVVYPQVDSRPAGFSTRWIRDILRAELGFGGAVFSDDLSMAGAAGAGDFVARAQFAQQAGCDMLLVCNNPQAAGRVLEALPMLTDAGREQRLLAMRGKPAATFTQLHDDRRWQLLSKRIGELTENCCATKSA